MDPELFAQLFAAQDATAVPRKREREPDSRTVSLLKNVVAGLDPTMGFATGATGMAPDRPSFVTQALVGLLGPAAAPKRAKELLGGLVTMMKRTPEDLVPYVRSRFGWSSPATGGYRQSIEEATEAIEDMQRAAGVQQATPVTGSAVRIEHAISGAPTETLKELDEAIINAFISTPDESTKDALRLIAARNNAEVAARATISGDELAKKAFTSDPIDADEFPGLLPFHPEDLDAFFDAEGAAEALNQNLANIPLYKFILGLD